MFFPCDEVEPGGHFELLPLLGDAVSLELFQFGGLLFALAKEARLLRAEIAELTLVVEEGVHVEERGTGVGRFVGDEIRELAAAVGVESHFERGDAVETPGDVG